LKGEDRCTLLMHHDNAARRGIADNDVFPVKSAADEIRVPQITACLSRHRLIGLCRWANRSRVS
jgi:hypothetical protein